MLVVTIDDVCDIARRKAAGELTAEEAHAELDRRARNPEPRPDVEGSS